jgi:hypothetical protein
MILYCILATGHNYIFCCVCVISVHTCILAFNIASLFFFMVFTGVLGGWSSVHGIATCYGLVGPRIESCWE